MLIGLWAFATIFAVALFLYRFQKRNHYKKLSTRYSILFGVCSLVLAVLLLNQHSTTVLAALSPKETDQQLEGIKEMKEAPKDHPLINQYKLKKSIKLEAPLINQYPELPRGCEVTSLAMLLNYHDIQTDKMKLAAEVTKNPAPYQKSEGKITYGHPNEGFVGDMYTLDKPGLGVYHKPIFQLASQYAGERVVDFTGQDFNYILNYLNDGLPVWIITNTTYRKLPEKYFQTWETPQGSIQITYKEHSVLVTGYDEKFIYFNDPILGKNKKAPIDDFKEAWAQMGKQAITIKNT
ncbi:C39 family peptidase [Thalassobacillus hwangdonensis]|uniref:C39 family peptidase n=1 Tax=Thalassobacillus hwangdonensis TaxID=546108 RepID=A0ABW3L3A5_9BACI